MNPLFWVVNPFFWVIHFSGDESTFQVINPLSGGPPPTFLVDSSPKKWIHHLKSGFITQKSGFITQKSGFITLEIGLITLKSGFIT